MKKTLALILSILALLIPVSAIELDVAEGAENAVEETAVLAAGQTVPATVAKYDLKYGELIYFEDFEDGNYENAYTNGSNAYFGLDSTGSVFSTDYIVSDTSNGGNYIATIDSNIRATIENPVHPTGSKLTVIIDTLRKPGATGTGINAWGYGTSEMWPALSIASVTETSWVTVAKTLNGTSSLNQGRQTMYFSGSSAYWDNFRIYAKYDIGDRVRLVEDGDYVFINAFETIPAPVNAKYTAWVDESGNVYNVGETAPAGTVLVAVAVAEKPAAVDASKGFLVFFDNGNEDDYYNNTNLFLVGQSAATFADGYLTRGIWNCGTYDAATNPTGFNTGDATHGIAVRTANGEGVAYADGTALNGTISAYFEMYNGTSSDKGFNSWSCFNPGGWASWCGGYTAWGSSTITNTAIAGQWTTLGAKLAAEKGSIGLARNAWDNHNSTALDIRSAYVYYMPNYRVTVDGTLVDLTGKTEYTLPAFDTADYDSYKDADGNVFVPGTYAVADINGKVLTPYLQPEYSAKPADETDDGFLVYFFNGKDSDLVKKVNIKLNKNTLKESTFVDNHYLRGFDCNITGCASHAGYIIAEDGEGFKFTDGSAVEGDFFIVWEVYSSTGTNVNDFVICDHCTWDGSWIGGIETNWQGVVPTKGEWTKIKRAHHANKGVTTIGIVETGWNMSSHMGEQGYGSVAVYYRPQYRVSLTDGTAKNMYDLNGETTYTLPAEYNGNAVEAWKVDGVVYLAGAEVAVADINGKTFVAVDADEYYAVYAPEAEGVEMRLTANTAKNGIRFKAALAPSKKAEASEAGFIVARADVLEKIGQDLTFDLSYEGVANAEGTLFVKGVAYNKAEGKNIVADILADGSEVYTGVCVGMNIENKVHVTSTLVARPYVKLDVAGNEITVYGAEQSASLYELVSAVKETEAYEGAKQYIDTVIATAEAN